MTKITNSLGTLTKSYELDSTGRLSKKTCAFLTEGVAEAVEVATPDEFISVLTSLRTDQAMAYGLAPRPREVLSTTRGLARKAGAIARSRKYFTYPSGPGVLFLDHDCDHVERPISRVGLLTAIWNACPELKAATLVWAASSSSHICNVETGKDLTHLRGQRLYILVADCTDIPRAGKVLYERLWLNGHGRYIVTEAGTRLDRNLIDSSVWQPERLDFAAGAHCTAPLVQRRPKPMVMALSDDFTLFDTRSIPDLSAQEVVALAEVRANARDALSQTCTGKRNSFIEKQGEKLALKCNITPQAARGIIKAAADRRELRSDFVLYAATGSTVSVQELLKNPGRWDGERFSDPLEPDYLDCAFVNLRVPAPYLQSYAHGGRRFSLVAQ